VCHKLFLGMIALCVFALAAPTHSPAGNLTPSVAVGAQYDTTHVYVAADDFDRFVASFLATFGGTASKKGIVGVTPEPSSALWQAVSTPVGALSVFGFQSGIPYPFGAERTGYLVDDLDLAVTAARENGADVLVAPFSDPIGRDAIIQWPGGLNMQLYWHTTPSTHPALATIPDNRVYVSKDRAGLFIRSFVAFSHGEILSDQALAPGVEIGRPKDTYRRVRIQSEFGKMVVLVTDGHLPYPYGRETTGYEVSDLSDTVTKAKAVGADVLVEPFATDDRVAVFLKFPGGYIAEVHALGK
jgi:predicted enzyme related to lactoylglutathione lyase